MTKFDWLLILSFVQTGTLAIAGGLALHWRGQLIRMKDTQNDETMAYDSAKGSAPTNFVRPKATEAPLKPSGKKN